MHLLSIQTAEGPHAAARMGTDVVDLAIASKAVGGDPLPASMIALLEKGEAGLAGVRRLLDTLAGARDIAAGLRESGAIQPEAKANLLAPVPDPHLILSCGRNYKSHMAEMSKGKAPPAPPMPTGFIKASSCVIGPGAAIKLPPTHPNMVDWEAEFCAVIGKPCFNVSADKALDYVVGYTMINDVSARDFIPPPDENGRRHMTPDIADLNILGKQFPTFCPMGPAIATKDELAEPENIVFTLAVNGEKMQEANNGDVYFNLAALIAYYSGFYQLRPGDVISSGSPAGVGFGFVPPKFLKAGDTVEISCPGIGSFVNSVVKG